MTKKNFWCSVPESNNFMGVSFDRKTKGSSKTEVSKLDISIVVDQEILRFEISVHDSVSMAVGCTLEDLVGKLFDFLRRKRPSNLSHIFLEIILAILKY